LQAYNEYIDFAERLVSFATTALEWRSASVNEENLRAIECHIQEKMDALKLDEKIRNTVQTIVDPSPPEEFTNSSDSVLWLDAPTELVCDPNVPDSEADICGDYKSIENSCGIARRSFDAGDYENLEALLEVIMERSEKLCGPQFPWRDEIMEMRAVTSWELGKLEKADILFNESFKGRARVMERLATESFRKGKRNSAQRLLNKHFEGREPIMESLALSYIQDQRWTDAKRILLELFQYDTEEDIRLQRMHTIATVCFAQKDFGEAEAWCLKAIMGYQTTSGERHHVFESIRLLARIYDEEGANVHVDAYKTVLSDLSPGVYG
jgi:Tetratricopeptide repeat